MVRISPALFQPFAADDVVASLPMSCSRRRETALSRSPTRNERRSTKSSPLSEGWGDPREIVTDPEAQCWRSVHGSVLADAPNEKNQVTLVYEHELPNAPGKSIKGVLLEHGPGDYSPELTRVLRRGLATGPADGSGAAASGEDFRTGSSMTGVTFAISVLTLLRTPSPRYPGQRPGAPSTRDILILEVETESGVVLECPGLAGRVNGWRACQARG